MSLVAGKETACLRAPPPPIKTASGALKPASATSRHNQANAVLVVKFNKTGSYALSGGQDRCLHLWNPHKGLHIKTYVGHGYEVLDIDVSQDNTKLASCGGDKMAYTWDVSTGNIIRKLRGHTAKINSIKYNEESSVVATASYDKTVKIWDCRSNSGEPIQEMDHSKDSVSSVWVSESEIITGSVDGCVRTYDIRAGKLRTDFLGQPVTCVSLSNDKNCILATCLDSTLRLLDKSSGELLNQYKGHKNVTYKIASCLTPDDAYIVCGSEDNNVYIWDLVDSKIVRTLKGHTNIVCGLSVHPDEPCVISSGVDGTVRVWN